MKRQLYTLILLLTATLFFQCQNPVTPTPPEPPDDEKYVDCLDTLANTTLDIVTWNIEQFSAANTDTSELISIIKTMDADIIGVQEISSISDFNTMVAYIDGWEAIIMNLSGGLNTGYLYKTSEITLNGNLTTIYNDNSSAFPRPPVVGTFTHTSGIAFTIMNIHLKCCGGTDNEDRRREASSLLKSYIDNNLANVPVLVVGDYNDEIQEAGSANVFRNLIDDSANYRFADMDIATGSNTNWSYPSWPSHIDHILITNELFDSWQSTSTLKLDNCLSGYEFTISDHRPVMARFDMQ